MTETDRALAALDAHRAQIAALRQRQAELHAIAPPSAWDAPPTPDEIEAATVARRIEAYGRHEMALLADLAAAQRHDATLSLEAALIETAKAKADAERADAALIKKFAALATEIDKRLAAFERWHTLHADMTAAALALGELGGRPGPLLGVHDHAFIDRRDIAAIVDMYRFILREIPQSQD